MSCPSCAAPDFVPGRSCAGCGHVVALPESDFEPTLPSRARISPAPTPARAATIPEVSRDDVVKVPGVPLGSDDAARAETPVDVALDPLVGSVLAGRYELLGLLAMGGMGRVYRARHRGLDRVVCVKVLRPSLVSDPTTAGRFEREARAASRIDHPNVVRVLDFGSTEQGTLYLAMEFVNGRDLRTVLREDGAIEERRLCHIGAELLAALAKAHAHGVVHRDLKPENIMIEPRRGDAEAVKVLDFGIAKILDPGLPALTLGDRICGTPLYMSPEQATGASIGPRSDLYSVGVILYQLATGALPFYSQNTIEVMTRHVNEVPIAPRLAAPDRSISPALDALIMRALSKEPADRPPHAEAFRLELLTLARAAPAGVTAPQVAPELNPPVPRALQPSVPSLAPQAPALEPPGTPEPSSDAAREGRMLPVRKRQLRFGAVALTLVLAALLTWILR